MILNASYDLEREKINCRHTYLRERTLGVIRSPSVRHVRQCSSQVGDYILSERNPKGTWNAGNLVIRRSYLCIRFLPISTSSIREANVIWYHFIVHQ